MLHRMATRRVAAWESALQRATSRGTAVQGGIAAEGSATDWVAARRAVSRRQGVEVGGFATEGSATGGRAANGIAVTSRQAAGGISKRAARQAAARRVAP